MDDGEETRQGNQSCADCDGWTLFLLLGLLSFLCHTTTQGSKLLRGYLPRSSLGGREA